jgi:endonuclease YncB( thermonuclease family)
MSSFRPSRTLIPALLLAVGVTGAWLLLRPAPARADGRERVVVPKSAIHYDDGDSIDIHWPGKETEHVRILGIDTPEVMHLEHDLPYAQPFGYEASGFLLGCVAMADKVELLRSGNKDRYGRTLAYLFLDGKNYSPLVIAARLAYGPSPRFGDNGLPEEYATCMAAAKAAGPLPFELPWKYRRRMHGVAAWMRAHGVYPHGGDRPEVVPGSAHGSSGGAHEGGDDHPSGSAGK